MFFLFEALVFTLVPLAIFHFSWNIQRLRKIPGPFLASVTDIWRSYWMRQGEYTLFVDKLHKKYGKLVRLGPNYVSVSDPAAVSTVYGTNPVWIKVGRIRPLGLDFMLILHQGDSYKVMIGMKDGKEIPSVVSTISEARHTVMKRGIGHAFTANSVLDYEHYIDESAAELFDVFRKQRSCNISSWFQLFTMDVLSRIAFSESLGFVANGGDVDNTIASIKTRFEYWNDWMAIPGLERLIFRNPIMKQLKAGSSSMAVMAAKKLYARKAATEPPPQRDLLQKYIEASEKHPEWVDTASIIGLTM
jgi:cytochrome P450